MFHFAKKRPYSFLLFLLYPLLWIRIEQEIEKSVDQEQVWELMLRRMSKFLSFSSTCVRRTQAFGIPNPPLMIVQRLFVYLYYSWAELSMRTYVYVPRNVCSFFEFSYFFLVRLEITPGICLGMWFGPSLAGRGCCLVLSSFFCITHLREAGLSRIFFSTFEKETPDDEKLSTLMLKLRIIRCDKH